MKQNNTVRQCARVWNTNPTPLNCKSHALTPRPHCLHKELETKTAARALNSYIPDAKQYDTQLLTDKKLLWASYGDLNLSTCK